MKIENITLEEVINSVSFQNMHSSLYEFSVNILEDKFVREICEKN